MLCGYANRDEKAKKQKELNALICKKIKPLLQHLYLPQRFLRSLLNLYIYLGSKSERDDARDAVAFSCCA